MSAELANVGVGDGPGTKAGVFVWRIENKICVPVPTESYGQFYSGDSYVVLVTVPKKVGNGFDWTVYNWCGDKSSLDEKGISAYKIVEIDDKLGGSPVQRSIQQGHEPDDFIQLWKPCGVRYLDGGVDSGFTHVERDVYEPRLFHLKGKRTVRSTQVPVACSSLNDGDVFVLDLGLDIFVWNGSSSNRQERIKGAELARHIRDVERHGRAKIHDEIVNGSGNDGSAQFWEALGGKGEIAAATEDKDIPAGTAGGDAKLFHVSDASGSLVVTPIETRPLTQELLDENDVFILDIGKEVFVWVGKGSTVNERKQGMKNAQDYVSQAGKPAHTSVTRLIQGSEPPAFTQWFKNWKSAGLLLPGQIPAGSGRGVAKVEQKEIDFNAVHAKKAEIAASHKVRTLDPAGKTTVWRIQNFDKVTVPDNMHGQFYAGDSFIILYEWPKSSKEKPFIFFWLGLTSSNDEKGAAALLASELDKSMGGIPIQVRVVQGKEPDELLSLFAGKMIVHEGGVASGFKNKKDVDSMDIDGVSLFHVKGTNHLNTRAVQVPEAASSLNSSDVFILITPETQFIWTGLGSNETEHKNGESIAKVIQGHRKAVHVKEGEEPEEFWSALGGKGEYPRFGEEAVESEPRLFEVSDASGRLEIEEIFGFSQADLVSENVFLLDTVSTVFVWIGSLTTQREKKEALNVAQKYVEHATDGRGESTIVRIDEGAEPGIFTCHFLGWDRKPAAAAAAAGHQATQQAAAPTVKAAAHPAAAPAAKVSAPAPAQPAPSEYVPSGDYADPKSKSYSYKDLLERPADVDPAHRELYLSDAEFKTVIGVDKNEYGTWKKWKQDEKKKAVKLF